DLEQSQYKLIELTPEVAALFEEIRIQKPVLCTKDKTFTIRKQHYSNSLLLLSPSLTFVPNVQNYQDPVFEVVDVLNYFCELTLSAPKIEQLNELLQPTIYKGPDEEREYKDKKFYTFDELDNLVQASVKELKQALKNNFALEINGYWRYIDLEYIHSILNAILLIIDLWSVQLECIPLKAACDAAKGYGHPTFIIQHIFECFSESVDNADESSNYFIEYIC
ncbi:19632_t:CDS:2, partial [Racocetra fulgida]